MHTPTIAALLAACAARTAPTAAEAPPPVATATRVGEVSLDGTPPVDPAWRDRVRPYSQVRTASLDALSPDGRAAFIRTAFGETAQVHRLDQPLGARHQLTFRVERVRSAALSPAGDRLVYGSDVGGDEQWQYFELDLATGASRLLTDGASRNESWRFDATGQRALLTSTARNGRDTDLYLAEVDGAAMGPPRLLRELEGSWVVRDWSADGRAVLLGQYRKVTDAPLWRLDLESGALDQLTPDGTACEDAAFAGGAGRVLVATDRGEEHVRLYDLAPGGPGPQDDTWTCLSCEVPWSVEELAVHPDGQRAAWLSNEDGWSALHLLDLGTGRSTLVEDAPRGVLYGLTWARQAPVLGLTANLPTSPGDVYTLHAPDGQWQRWTRSEAGGLDPEGFVVPTSVAWESFDGRRITGLAWQPAGEGPFPVVIDIHGGPEGQSRPWFAPATQLLVQELGAVVIKPNVRGSVGYGRSWTLLDDGMQREDSVKDIGALLDWIGTQPQLDASRVAVIGGSYGGYMVLASLAHYGERLVAGVDSVGIANFVTFLENTKPYRQDLRRVEYGDERDPQMRAFLERISPVNQVDRMQADLFVVHGANDPRVPASEAEQIVAALRARGKDAWYMLAHDEGHGMSRKSNRELQQVLMVQFLERKLRP